MLDAIETRLFVGDPETFQIDNQTARVPYDSTLAMTSGHFQIAGELMAASIVQGGPAPDFLAEWLQTVDSDKKFQDLLMQDNVLDQLSKIGYRGVPHRESLKNKPSLIRYAIWTL
ncbi:Hypothetical predicted protein [Paramuricea clavata]|uniref:Uncharacterized protein n=1 Tax=Paramuricea clavata TaxID=317549 RepID=A0A6S7HSX6_PARCT|nr:Hypothetical predicted protein [Paramuricea clavata]